MRRRIDAALPTPISGGPLRSPDRGRAVPPRPPSFESPPVTSLISRSCCCGLRLPICRAFLSICRSFAPSAPAPAFVPRLLACSRRLSRCSQAIANSPRMKMIITKTPANSQKCGKKWTIIVTDKYVIPVIWNQRDEINDKSMGS